MSVSQKTARPLSASLLAPKGAARPSQPVVTDHGQPQHLFDVPATTRPAKGTFVQAKSTQTAEVSPKSPAYKKAAFTFRLCEQRHFRLRLLNAHQNRSSQKIMEDALDAYLEAHAPQTAGMACPCFQTSDAD